MKPNFEPIYAFEDFMEPTVVDPVLSGTPPVKSNFIKPTDWMNDAELAMSDVESEEVDDLTVVELKPRKLVHEPTPWENLISLTKRALHRMRENLRT